MELREVLSVLSKASSFSVVTEVTSNFDSLRRYKDYLYIGQQIENDYRLAVDELRAGEILFLCGSSGDGKSEIMTRSQAHFCSNVRFHLDATHSSSPRQTAVEALDHVFDLAQEEGLPLVVGINIGMMSNYAADGAVRHRFIKDAMQAFLTRDQISAENPCRFIDFESYPKFHFEVDGTPKADFPLLILERLTAPIAENPFHVLFLEELALGRNYTTTNFQILGVKVVQECIVRCLFKARLLHDQFLTARTLLDLVHHLLTRDEYLYDSLFTPADNELGRKISSFDPARWHSRELDLFLVKQRIGIEDVELASFLEALRVKGYLLPNVSTDSVTLIRMFYILQEARIDNDFHKKFAAEFNEHDGLFEVFSQSWSIHNPESEPILVRNRLKDLYLQTIIPALQSYLNRRAFDLADGRIHLATRNKMEISAATDILPDFSGASKNIRCSFDRFMARIYVNGERLNFEINIGLLEMLFKIHAGYRPSRSDEKSLVALDEIAGRIRTVAQKSAVLVFRSLDSRKLGVEVRKLSEDLYSVK